MLVCMGSALFTLISLSFDIEPARIAAGIVAGIGFLGAGSIIAHKGHVRGITSAATLWVVAAVGLAVGVGQYWIAIVSGIAIFLILQLGKLEKHSNHTDDEGYHTLIFFEKFYKNMYAGGEFRTRDLQIMSIALVGEPLEFTK